PAEEIRKVGLGIAVLDGLPFERRRRRGRRAAAGGEPELMFEPLADAGDCLGQPVQIVPALPLTGPAARRLDEHERTRVWPQPLDKGLRREQMMERVEHADAVDG